ncbi:MAG TPA: hydrogen peroxide-inducible genes activator [Alphaproteobacteria bacterium]|nr:hydrogen peroxide-inducible genes activator [Alphaproteobacteria bacterium]
MINLPTLRQLRHLTALAEHRHFGKAAAACHVTQSTLSASIKELEDTLGAALVDRTKRSVVLTPLGEETVRRGRRVLQEAEELALNARAAGEPLSGALRMGVIPTISPFLLPQILPTLRRAYPKLKLYLKEDLTERLIEQLENGQLDVVLMALPYDARNLETEALFEDRFSLAVPRDHPLAAEKRVKASELEGEPLLLLQDGHCLRQHALSACGIHTRRPVDAFEATSLHTLVQMVDNGLGITLLPQLAIDAGIAKGTRLVFRPLVSDEPSREIGLAWRRGTARRDEFHLLGRAIAHLVKEREKKEKR